MKEGGHWYNAQGEPVFQVPCKSRPGETRPTTLADARKLKLFPSVTTVLDIVGKPELIEWLRRVAVDAALTTPRRQGESLDEFKERILAHDAEDESNKARDFGTDVHAAIAWHLAGHVCQEVYKPYVDAALLHINTLGRVVASEKIVTHPLGFAGTTDCLLEWLGLITVLDFKTTKKLPKKGAWDSHLLQVAAYAAAQGNTGDQRMQTAVLYISTTEPGQTALFVNPDWQPDWTSFQDAYRLWKRFNHYDPLA